MAFQRRQSGGSSRPVMSIAISAKQGKNFIKGPSTGVWVNDKGGPAFRGTISPEKAAEFAEFFANMADAGLGGQVSVFDNSEEQSSSKKPFSNGFKKSGAGFANTMPAKKPNPFRKPAEEASDEPSFGDE